VNKHKLRKKKAFKDSELTSTRTCCKAKAKDLSFKAKVKAKNLKFKAKVKELSFEAKAKAKDTKIVLKDSLRTKPKPRPMTNITGTEEAKHPIIPGH